MRAHTTTHSAEREERIPQAPLWLWLVTYLLFGFVLYASYQGFWLWRSSIQNLTDVLLYRDLWRQPAYLAGVMFAGITFFAIAIGSESYLRGALTRPLPTRAYVVRLAVRFARTLLVLAVALGAGALAQELLFRAVR